MNKEIEVIQSAGLELNTGNIYQPNSEEIRISWNHLIGRYVTQNEVLFTIIVDAKEYNDRDFNLLATQMRPEIYTGEGLEIRDLATKWIDATSTKEYALYQNEPNPFITETSIGFSLAKDSDITITIYDATGKVFKTIQGEYTAGSHNISVNA